MKIEEIRELAEIMQTYGLERLELEEGGSRVSLRRAVTSAAPPTPALPVSAAQEPAPQEPTAGKVVTSPMVGVFYSSPTPGADPFVTVGKRVTTGEVLCIVEAMKIMNDLAAEFDGEVAAVHVSDGDLVEVGQPLFTLI